MTRKLRYVSVFSGIEAVSCALDPDVWEPVAFIEIDPFPSAVLAHHYPDVPNLGDITKIDWTPYVGSVDVVFGGSPCTSFSIAGNREGLKGESGLMFEFIRCVRELGPRWFVWENVPGALSSENGHAFGQLLSEMAGGGDSMCDGLTVRRLTPVECERLQGFPDGWTDIPYRGKEHPADGPRYKALGNSMAVPVMKWISERIQAQELGKEVEDG